MNPEQDRLVHRLINTWDGDLTELIMLVELVAGIRKRGIAFAQERHARVAEHVAIVCGMDGDSAGEKIAQHINVLIRQCS
jgi:hypothetical protein